MATLATVPRNQQLDLGQYDRSPELTDNENRTFETWAANPLFKLGEYRLPRLFPPLADVLSSDDFEPQGRLRTIRFILEEVGRRRQAYWGWGDAEWLELLHSPAATSNKVTKPYLLAVAYTLGGFRRMYDLRFCFSLPLTARAVFGATLFDHECQRLLKVLRGVGYGEACMPSFMPTTFAAVALENGSPLLETFNEAALERVADRYRVTIRTRVTRVSHGLTLLGIMAKPLNRRPPATWRERSIEGIHPDWARWCQKWRDTSTFRSNARGTHYSYMLRTGLWLAKVHPEVTSPAHWSVGICADFLAVVDRLTVGEWSLASNRLRFPNRGKPLDADTKSGMLQAVRRLLTDCQLWEWTTLRCNPRYHLATPNSIKRHLGVNPRTIDDAIWLKLIWASLNLKPSDLPRARFRYPFEAMQALAVIWTHAGLRGNEILRLRLGCARAQDDAIVDDAGASVAPGTLCYLDVPAGKTFIAFSKPVAAAVKLYVDAWTAIRPEQVAVVDQFTGERAKLLFQHRGAPMSTDLLNRTVIPMLCVKAGVSLHDTRGRITSHRGRASAVTALANAPQGMTLLDLMTWCGHRNPQSTMYYVRVKPTRLASAFAKADRMAHMIEVVVDHQAIANGSGRPDAAPWKYYDLGDSYCSNAFWSTCPHRMACAGCFFNIPKASAKGQALEAQRSAARLLEEVWLSPDERAAVEGDVTALQGMLAKLQDVPALDGRTPGQIMSDAGPDEPP